MDEIERELRDTLSDSRLSLPVRPDALTLLEAGVRRRRRNRALATVSAAVVLLAGGVTAASLATGRGTGSERIVPPVGGGSPTPAVKPTLPPRSSDEVPWAPIAYDYQHPPIFPGTAADLSVPWCHAGELSLSQAFQGATGNWVGGFTVMNTSSSTCALQGQPEVRIEAANGRVLLSSHPEPFYVDQWVRLLPGAPAYAPAQWMQEFCHEPAPVRIVVDLPHRGGLIATSMSGAPRCNSQTDPPSAGRLDVDGFVSSQDGPFTPLAGVEASIDTVATVSDPGGVVTYRLQLQSSTSSDAALDPCLPYRARLVNQATNVVLVERDHFLNCSAAPTTIPDAQSMRSLYFDLRLPVPTDAPAGEYALVWQSVLKPVNTVANDNVRIRPATRPCVDGDLVATAGRGGAATGHYGMAVVFRNTSATACALRGYPGVALLDRDGHEMTPAPKRGDAFVFTDPGPMTVVLEATTGVASFEIGGEDYDPVHQRECPSATTIAVYAPGTRGRLIVATGFPSCPGGVTFSAVVPGRLGPRS